MYDQGKIVFPDFSKIMVIILTMLLVGCGPVVTAVPISAISSPLSLAVTQDPSAVTQVLTTKFPVSPTVTITTVPPTGSASITFAATSLPEELEIRVFLEKLVANDQFSGAVVFALDGKPVLRDASGMADQARATPNQIDTKFNLGSMNKMFTAVAIMQLVEQGR